MIDLLKKNLLSGSIFILFSILGFNTIFMDMLPCFKECTKNFAYIFNKNDQISHLKVNIYCNYSGDQNLNNSNFDGHLLLSSGSDPGKIRFNSIYAQNSLFFSTEEDFFIKNQKEGIYGIKDLIPNRLFLGIASKTTRVLIKQDNKLANLDSKIKIMSENSYYSDVSKFSIGLASVVSIILIFIFTISNKQDEIKLEPQKKQIIIMN